MINATVFLGSDNEIELSLQENGGDLEATGENIITYDKITRCQVIIYADPTITVDSYIDINAFDLTKTDRIVLKLNAIAGLVVGTYPAKLKLFIATSSLGLSWLDFTLTVRV